ncbi:MAG: molybdopterin biosynthesis protein [Candidatus Methanomethylicia archaeon]|jgi:putative molybdopterin biosynthesis protein|nr:molybdopterin biosynthesis protein [Candidatus Methanomethylicia archaeon]
MRKIFHELVSIEEALDRLFNKINKNIETEVIDIYNAYGRVLAKDIISPIDLPPFDRAEVDGYAVLSLDLEGASEQNPIKLKVIGSINPGDNILKEISRGECIEISTGAPIPKGADAVVMVEYTKREGDYVEIFKSITPGENIAFTGSDIEIGTIILRKGTYLTVKEIALLAALGFKKIEVYKKPLIGIISTGNELLDQECILEYGKIYDVNTPMFYNALKEEGVDVIFLGRAKDDYNEIKELLANGLKKCNAIILSGGTSAGIGDIVYRVLEDCCDQGIIVHGLKVKPGKPTVIAIHEGKPVFGLPGFPVSALMIFNEIVIPYINYITKKKRKEEKKIIAYLSDRVNTVKGKKWFLPVHLIKRNSIIAYPIIMSSGAIGTLSRADGYIIVDDKKEFLDKGEKVEVNLFNEELADIVIIGSNCYALDILVEIIFEKYGLKTKLINVGSLAGLEAIRKDEADIAGTHLFDPETGTYNKTFLRKMNIPEEYLIKGYKRLQGIIVKKGNPKNIKGIEDLIEKDITFINRNRGSGTRALIDYLLKKICNEKGLNFNEVITKIKGYRIEAKTHSAVAAAISQGKADMGIGILSAAIQYGLDFIPLCYEEYDFVINPNGRFNDIFIKCLRSKEFLDRISKMPGYKIGGE